jgi:hypothetical protein
MPQRYELLKRIRMRFNRRAAGVKCLALIINLVIICCATAVNARNLIVFAGQHFIYRSFTDVVAAEPGRHIYEIWWPHGHVRQVTFGRSDDSCPCLSPDRENMAFLRMSPSGITTACVLNLSTHRLRVCLNTGATSFGVHCCWSPDGKYIGVADDGDFPNCAKYAWIVGRKGTVNSFYDFQTLSWSPDSKHVFLGRWNQPAKIAAVNSTARILIHRILPYGYWLDNTDIVCSGNSPATYDDCNLKLIVLNDLGKGSYPIPSAIESDGFDFQDTEHFICVGAGVGRYFLVVYHHESDWDHPLCLLMKRPGYQSTYLGEIDYPTPLPGDASFVGVVRNWVGRYKWGGQKLGNLYFFQLPSTKQMQVAYDGDFQIRPSMKQKQITYGYLNVSDVDLR